MTYPLSYKATALICFIMGAGTLLHACFLVGAWRDKCDEEKVRWGMRTFFTGAIFALFLILSLTFPTCSNCGEKVNTDYCTNCGAVVEENITPICPECGEVCHTNFCGECGTQIQKLKPKG